MSAQVIDEIAIIDADTHVAEPYDLWTSRLSEPRWGDRVPHVRWVEEIQKDAWFFGDTRVHLPGRTAMAGWAEYYPSCPPHLHDADPACWRLEDRLRWMDHFGIGMQVLYPNVQGFGTGRFLALEDPELMLACVSAYNDYLVDLAGEAPGRFVLNAALPFWDLDLTLAEMERARRAGHHGVVFAQRPEVYGQPCLTDPHWDRLWDAAQGLEMPVNFHVGASEVDFWAGLHPSMGAAAVYSANGPVHLLDNARTISHLIHAGVLHRHPDLKVVSVESGVGWLPFVLDKMEWSWSAMGVDREHPEYLRPTDYFLRQVYGCFWFEDVGARYAIERLGADNFLFETDFPHVVGMHPGPASNGRAPRDHLRDSVADLPDDQIRKILRDNAASLYHVR